MPRFPLCGPSYSSTSLTANAQRCVNLYLEADESGTGKSPLSMFKMPGLKTFASLTGETGVFGTFVFQGRAFAAGKHFFEIFQNGTIADRGLLGIPTGPISIAGNQANQLLIACGGQLSVYSLALNTLTPVNMLQLSGAVSQVAFIDAFFIALIANSNRFQLSGLLDGTSWSGLDANAVEKYPDNIVTMLTTFDELWLLGEKQSIGYVNTGATDTPFLPIPGAQPEQGSAAVFGAVVMDNAPHWLGANANGQRMAWRADGYTPKRISNHAVENEWNGYSTIADAESYTWSFKGHTFWQIRFPTANKTWLYDASTNMWMERQHFDFGAHRSRCHMYVFGKHLVGDPLSGNIYDMSDLYFDDFGTSMRWLRRTPAISKENDRLTHSRLEVLMETGLAPALYDGNGNQRGAEMMLRWSNDYAHTWSNEYILDCGKTGEYRKRIIRHRNGMARGRVYEISGTDAVPVHIIDGYAEAS